MLDKKDKIILEVLMENSRLSIQKISRKTSIPITTIYNRIKKLEDLKIIKKYSIVLDNKKLGMGLLAYVLISADYKLLKEYKISQHDLARKIKFNEFVEEVDMITGEWDLIIKVRIPGIDDLDTFITGHLRNLDGVNKTRTIIVLSEVQ